MPVFAFIAKDGEGKIVKGAIEADSEEAVVAHLRDRGLWVQKVTSDQPGGRKAGASGEPIQRVIETILRTAIEQGVEHVEVEASAEKVTVLYAVGEERHETMSMPAYVWPALLKECCEMAGAPQPQEGSETGGAFRFEAAGKTADVLFMGSPTGLRLEISPD